MKHAEQFYIDGAWTDPVDCRYLDVIDPATEEAFDRIALGGTVDVDRAVAAAREAFPAFSATSRVERIALLERIATVYKTRQDEIGQTISRELGAPLKFATQVQAGLGLNHTKQMISVLESYVFEERLNDALIVREAIGVCALITPWNWPINQIFCKILPALAAGCTMILKPSEMTPLNAIIVAEILDAAGVPAGVFNLVNGDGPGVGSALSSHPDIDMISFTGSTRAGILVAKSAADSVKRVHQELGGKSANIILPDVDLKAAVDENLRAVFTNSGQTCTAPTKMMVHMSQYEAALDLAAIGTAAYRVGDPSAPESKLGPVVSAVQYEKIQDLIQSGIAEGARLVAGGPGRPEGLNRGYYVRPTVFADVQPDMRIYREEIFGPVLSVMPYKDEDEAIRLANDTEYGLAGYVQSSDLDHARHVARQIRAGRIEINNPDFDLATPFGGYKKSGNGREFGKFGLDDFTEIKSLEGYFAQ